MTGYKIIYCSEPLYKSMQTNDKAKVTEILEAIATKALHKEMDKLDADKEQKVKR